MAFGAILETGNRRLIQANNTRGMILLATGTQIALIGLVAKALEFFEAESKTASGKLPWMMFAVAAALIILGVTLRQKALDLALHQSAHRP